MGLLGEFFAKEEESRLLSLGYRKEEVKLSLLDAEKPDAATITVNGKTFGEIQASQLKQRACELGVKDIADEFPFLKKQKPTEAKWQRVEQPFVSPRVIHLQGDYLVYLEGSNFILKRADRTYDADAYFSVKDTPALYDHLTSGYFAYIKVKAGNLDIHWITVPNYELLKAWYQAKNDYNHEIKAWEKMVSSIETVTQFNAALAQERRLEDLPFEWRTDIKEVLSGLSESSMGNGCKTNTVKHLMLVEDYSNGRLVRGVGDYLCSPKKVANWSGGDCEHHCYMNGTIVKTIQHEITCKSCLARIDAILKSQQS